MASTSTSTSRENGVGGAEDLLKGMSSEDLIKLVRTGSLNPFDVNFKMANLNNDEQADIEQTLNTPDVLNGLTPARPTASLSQEAKLESRRKSSSSLSIKMPENCSSTVLTIASELNQGSRLASELVSMIQKQAEEPHGQTPATATVVETVLDLDADLKNPTAKKSTSSVSSRSGSSMCPMTPTMTANVVNTKPMPAFLTGQLISFVPVQDKYDELERANQLAVSSTSYATTRRPISNCSSSDDTTRQHASNLDETGRRQEMLDRNKAAAVRYRKRKRDEQQTLRGQIKVLDNEKLALQTRVNVLNDQLERLQSLLTASEVKVANCKCGAVDESARTPPNQVLVNMPDGTRQYVQLVSPAIHNSTIKDSTIV